MDLKGGQPSNGALVVDLAKAVEKVQLSVVWYLAICFGFRQKVLRVLCGYFAHERRVMFVKKISDPMSTVTAILPGSRWYVLFLTSVM